MSCIPDGFDLICGKDETISVNEIQKQAKTALGNVIASVNYSNGTDNVIDDRQSLVPDHAIFTGESTSGSFDGVVSAEKATALHERELVLIEEDKGEKDAPVTEKVQSGEDHDKKTKETTQTTQHQNIEIEPTVYYQDERSKTSTRAQELEALRQRSLASQSVERINSTDSDIPINMDHFQRKQREWTEEQRQNQKLAREGLHAYRADDKQILEEIKRTSPEKKGTTVDLSAPAYSTMSELGRLDQIQREISDWKRARDGSFDGDMIAGLTDREKIDFVSEKFNVDVSLIQSMFDNGNALFFEEALANESSGSFQILSQVVDECDTPDLQSPSETSQNGTKSIHILAEKDAEGNPHSQGEFISHATDDTDVKHGEGPQKIEPAISDNTTTAVQNEASTIYLTEGKDDRAAIIAADSLEVSESTEEANESIKEQPLDAPELKSDTNVSSIDANNLKENATVIDESEDMVNSTERKMTPVSSKASDECTKETTENEMEQISEELEMQVDISEAKTESNNLDVDAGISTDEKSSLPEEHKVETPVKNSITDSNIRQVTAASTSRIKTTASTKPKEPLTSFEDVRYELFRNDKPAKEKETTSQHQPVALKHVPLYARQPSIPLGKKDHTDGLSTTAISCPGKYIPNLHSSRDACERCLYWASPSEKARFWEKGRHLRIMMIRGGCGRNCSVFPRQADEHAVRLCKKCYFDTHRVSNEFASQQELRLLWSNSYSQS